jgi:hypothetical protein
LFAESAGLEELVTQLTELSVKEGSMPPIAPKVGAVVRGLFPADNRWYRAKVAEINGDKYKLFYVDYGNVRSLPVPPRLSLFPSLPWADDVIYFRLKPLLPILSVSYLKTPT